MKPKATVAERLKEIMELRQLKQVDILKLAEPYCEKYNVKLNSAYLSQYVTGKFEPTQDRLYILAKALDVSESWLMGYDVSILRVPDEQRKAAEPEASAAINDILCLFKTMTPEQRALWLELGRSVLNPPAPSKH